MSETIVLVGKFFLLGMGALAVIFVIYTIITLKK